MSLTFQNPSSIHVQLPRFSNKLSLLYLPAIDGLRAVAVLAVAIFHLKHEWLPGGFVGVDVFFVISGYLITSILLREYGHSSFSLWKFYQRRIARLFPAFFTVALATLLGACFIYSAQDLASCGANLVSATLSVANLKYMSQGNYFTISPDAQPFLHYWSLFVEEQFYLLFPVTLLLLYLKANRHKTVILGVLCITSAVACVALTNRKPEWAFYLLPTRAWELLAGSIIANIGGRTTAHGKSFLWTMGSVAGLALIIMSLFAITEGPTFPGYHAMLPVLGAALFLGSTGGASKWPERVLSTGPMVWIGRTSYSLYLCHWPVFSFVDYKFYLAAPLVRIGLKVTLSALGTVLCFFLIETPGRLFLSQPRRRLLAFALLGSALVVCALLGTIVRRANYVDAGIGIQDIADGGLVFNQAGTNGSMVLLGDSNGSMYGKMVKEIAKALGLRLHVMSVAAGDPLPHSSGSQPKLWHDSLAFVKHYPPDIILLVCNWESKLSGEKGRLEIAINELEQHTRRLILITQPPQLPESGDREFMRNGSRPPFREDPVERLTRIESNAVVKRCQSKRVIIIDIDPLFAAGDGSVRFTADDGALLYHDGNHLSDAGANVVKPDLIRAIRQMKTDF